MSSGWPDGTPGLVVLPSGRRLVGAPARDLASLTPPPQVVLRLDRPDPGPESGPRPDWASTWVDWPDFRTPRDTDHALAALVGTHDAAASQRVAVACRGGRGRTGTALAVVAVLDGVPASEAVAWIRRHYRAEAVETWTQRRWVVRAAGLLGLPTR